MGNYTGSLDTLWWSPEEYAQLAQDLTKVGKKYEECVNAAAEAINSLGTSGAWTGYLYNQLIARFNEKKTQLDDDAETLTRTIPVAISNQAQKQAETNHGYTSSLTVAALDGIINPIETEDDGTGKVYIDPETVVQGIDAFNDNMTHAVTNVKEYLDKFESTVANGWNVSKDIKAMGSSIEEVVSRVMAFADEFSKELDQCAVNSAAIMSAAQEASAAEAQNIQ